MDTHNQSKDAHVGKLICSVDQIEFGELVFSMDQGFSVSLPDLPDETSAAARAQQIFKSDWETIRKGILDGCGAFADSGECVCPTVHAFEHGVIDGELRDIARLKGENLSALRNMVEDLTGGVSKLSMPEVPRS